MPSYPSDFDAASIATIEAVQPYTMTSPERIHAVCEAVKYLARHDVPGDIVECGVWRGASMMAVAKPLLTATRRPRLHLFDTFSGMTEPAAIDCDSLGRPASLLLAAANRATSQMWGVCPLEEVRRNMNSTG